MIGRYHTVSAYLLQVQNVIPCRDLMIVVAVAFWKAAGIMVIRSVAIDATTPSMIERAPAPILRGLRRVVVSHDVASETSAVGV